MKVIARLLEKGDWFLYRGSKYVVLCVLENVVCYMWRGQGETSGQTFEMGINSKEKIILLKDGYVGEIDNLNLFIFGKPYGKPKKPTKTKPLKKISEYKKIHKSIRQADRRTLTTSSHFK